jgi:hypothetical protein
MNTPEKNGLLNDVLDGDQLSSLRQATLAGGLDAMRQRARRRRQFQAAAIMASLAFVAVRWHFQPIVPAPVEKFPAPKAMAETSKVKYITEKELFALFPNRPIALIGPPGHQQFILLDELKQTREQ